MGQRQCPMAVIKPLRSTMHSSLIGFQGVRHHATQRPGRQYQAIASNVAVKLGFCEQNLGFYSTPEAAAVAYAKNVVEALKIQHRELQPAEAAGLQLYLSPFSQS